MTVESLRFLDKSQNQSERELMSSYYREQIEIYGLKCIYYRAGFDTSSDANVIYGEDATTMFSASANMIVYIDAPTINMSIVQFGWYSQDDVTFYIHQDVFTETFATSGQTNPIPKSGDKLQFKEFDNIIYEVVFRNDAPPPNANLIDYYTYVFNGKRQVYDGTDGVPDDGTLTMEDSVTDRFNLPTDTEPALDPTDDPTFPGDNEAIDNESNRIYDYEPDDEDKEYGGYDYTNL